MHTIVFAHAGKQTVTNNSVNLPDYSVSQQ